MSTFNQGNPSVSQLISAANCIVYGNTSSGNALSVQQLGAGNVFVTSNASGRVGLFVSATSNVGVGTTNPQTTLQVSGPANTAGARATPYANAFVSVINDIIYGTTSQVGLEIGSGTRASGDNDRVYKYVFNAINNATFGAGVDFQILAIPTAPASYASDGTARNRMTIRYDGNVGIGTANPANLLHVYGGNIQLGSTGTASILNSVTGSDFGNLTLQSGYQGTSSAPRINIVGYTGAGTVNGDNIIQLATNGSTRMTINQSGAVGIGTTNPTYALDVNGGYSSYLQYGGVRAPSYTSASYTTGTISNGANGTYTPNILGNYGGIFYFTVIASDNGSMFSSGIAYNWNPNLQSLSVLLTAGGVAVDGPAGVLRITNNTGAARSFVISILNTKP